MKYLLHVFSHALAETTTKWPARMDESAIYVEIETKVQPVLTDYIAVLFYCHQIFLGGSVFHDLIHLNCIYPQLMSFYKSNISEK